MADTFTETMQEKIDETVNPATAAARGATPKQIDMAATPASKVGKLGVNSTGVRGNTHEFPSPAGTTKPVATTIQPPKVTEEARILADRRYMDQVTEDQKARAAEQLANDSRLNRLKDSGDSLRNLIQNNIDKLIDKEKLAKEGGAVELTVDTLPKEVETQVHELSTAWQALPPDATDEQRNEVIGNLITILGKPGADGKVTVDSKLLRDAFPDADEATIAMLSTAMADHVTMDDDIFKSMGYADEELPMIKDQLGLTGTETISEYQEKLNSYRDKVLKPIGDLESSLTNPNLMPSEREAAREALRDQGYLGVLADGAKLDKLAGDVSLADKQITIGDKTYGNLEDFLSDENVTGLVSSYLNGDITEEQLPPGLAGIIDSNREVLGEAIKELDTEVKAFDDVQSGWKSIKDSNLDDSVLKAIVPGYDPAKVFYTSAVPDMSGNNTFKWLTSKDTTQAQKVAISGMINDLATNGLPPEGVQAVMNGLSNEELTQLQDVGVRDSFVQGLQFGSTFKEISANVDSYTPEQVIAKLSGLESPDELADLAADLKIMQGMGDAKAGELLATLYKFYDPTSAANTLNNFRGLTDFGDLAGVSSAGDLIKSIKDRVALSQSASAGDMRTLADMIQGDNDLASRDPVGALNIFESAIGVRADPVTGKKSVEDFVAGWNRIKIEKSNLQPILDAKFAEKSNYVKENLSDLNDQNWVSKGPAFANAFSDWMNLAQINPDRAMKELKGFMRKVMTPHEVSQADMEGLFREAKLDPKDIGLDVNGPIGAPIDRAKLNDKYGPLVRINQMLKAGGQPPILAKDWEYMYAMLGGKQMPVSHVMVNL